MLLHKVLNNCFQRDTIVHGGIYIIPKCIRRRAMMMEDNLQISSSVLKSPAY